MSILSSIKALLEADSTLLATATGGVWDYDETGRAGINRTATTAAFDSNLIVKPCILVKSRSVIPDYLIADDSNQYTTARENIECWVYQSAGFDKIDTMKLRIYALLHAKQVSGAFKILWAGDTQPLRDTDLDAFTVRSDYTVITKRSV